MIYRLGTLIFSLQQQSQVERCVDLVMRDLHCLAQAFDAGFGSPLIVEQVAEIVPSLRKCRIDPCCWMQRCLGYDIAAMGV